MSADTERTASATTGESPSGSTIRSSSPHHDTRSLFRGSDRAVIVHEGTPYLLRLTRNGKLILTK
ncbi:MAG: hemin uptake protein HemP [Pseudomonadota bacterium]|jgi:hemin uptake protein HemP|nr:hemin uptake protein HemP [Pseudomonadota bacterium]